MRKFSKAFTKFRLSEKKFVGKAYNFFYIPQAILSETNVVFLANLCFDLQRNPKILATNIETLPPVFTKIKCHRKYKTP
jgi:hypothetical protein